MIEPHPHARFALGGPVQIAYAVGDLEVAAERWVERRVGPFFVREHIEVVNSRIRGVEAGFDHSSAFTQWGEVMLELIHQHDATGEAIVGTAGLHHVAHFVDDFDVATAALAASGYPELLYAETAGGTTFAFHDARHDQGHLIEIYERTAPLARFYDMVRSAAAGWDGADPIRRL